MLKVGPLRDEMERAATDLEPDARVGLRNADPAAVHALLSRTARAAAGVSLTVWNRNCCRGRVGRLHGLDFLFRMGVARLARDEHEVPSVVVDGRPLVLLPLTAGWRNRWAALGTLQTVIGIYMRNPFGT